jgi:hypothetical protein
MSLTPDIIKALRIITNLAWGEVRGQDEQDAIELIEKFTEENAH